MIDNIVLAIVVLLCLYGIGAAIAWALSKVRDANIRTRYGRTMRYSVWYRTLCWPWYLYVVLRDPTNSDY
jgi:hypothetical protein